MIIIFVTTLDRIFKLTSLKNKSFVLKNRSKMFKINQALKGYDLSVPGKIIHNNINPIVINSMVQWVWYRYLFS